MNFEFKNLRSNFYIVYNHKEREVYWKDYWGKEKIYAFQQDSKKKIYSVDTPPPYVSADHLHVGHVMSYSQAEFVVRYKRMSGYNIFYPMGFDDNGLPTERFVEKKYKIDKSKIKRDDFIKLCLKETEKGIKTYRNLWENLGISVDWTKTYSTIDKLSQKVSQWSFLDLYQKKVVKRKKEAILWCVNCGTALAQADLEDKNLHTKLNSINFQINGKNYPIATTRPELLPACVALFANPEDKRYKNFQNHKAIVPLFNYKVPILFDEEVDIEYGTGLMMVCSWGDTGDIKRIRENNLTPRVILEKNGKLGVLAGEYNGLKIKEAREKILTDLKKLGLLIEQKYLEHNVNVHERCNTPVEFVLSEQWFIDVLGIKDNLLSIGEKMNWYPQNQAQKYIDWINSLKWDWCISRQRYFGVPFPIWYCKICDEIKIPEEKELPVDPTLTLPTSSCSCSSSEFLAEKDVMDTWATSSCTNIIVKSLFKKEDISKDSLPLSLRPQGYDIIRTWLFYTIVKSYHHFGDVLPFVDIMISGWGVDERGKKLSKRLNNYAPIDELLLEYGADSIRYWAAGAGLGENRRFNLKDIKRGRQLINKIWNAYRFIELQIDDDELIKIEKNDLEIEDRWILNELNETIKISTLYFEKYEYSKAKNQIEQFFWNSFCDFYIEISKHRADTNAVKYSLMICMKNILKLFAPFLPFITEELYQKQFIKDEQVKSIHLTQWPQISDIKLTDKEKGLVSEFLKEIQMIRKEKSARKIGLNAEMLDYKIQTNVNLDIFGKKLKKIGKIN